MVKVKGIEIKIVKGDIVHLTADALVNPANTSLSMGGGVAAAYLAAGGPSIQEEAFTLAPVAVGKAVATYAGSLKAQYIIHTVTIGIDLKTDEFLVRAACRSALELAQQMGLRSVALPALGCGTGGFPLLGTAKIMAQEFLRAGREAPGGATLREILLCVRDDEAYDVFEKQINGYLRHVLEDLAWGPYICADIIIEINDGIVIIERTNPPLGWALPGGFVDRGESLETAAVREAKEETNLDLKNLRQFHTYSDPTRDPRFHTISTIFTATGIGTPKAGDDAQALKVVPFKALRQLKYAFDHNTIMEDYLRSKGL